MQVSRADRRHHQPVLQHSNPPNIRVVKSAALSRPTQITISNRCRDDTCSTMSSPADIHNNNKAKQSPNLRPNLPSALSLPPKWLAMYDDFVTKNASQVSQMESALRSLTYIIPGIYSQLFASYYRSRPHADITPSLPGRFRDAELATEGIHSGVQLLSLYHDLLLFRNSLSPSPSTSPTTSGPAKPPASSITKSLHVRYTRFWAAKSTLYRRVAVVLQVVQYTELLLEMWAKRRGEAVRWRVVVLIEAVKAICRLLLLRITRSRPLISPALPEREPVPEAEEAEEEDGKALAELMGEEEQVDENGGAINGSVAGNGADTAAFVKHDGTNGNGNGNGAQHKPNGNGNGNGHLSLSPPAPSASPFDTTTPNKREWPMPRTGLTLPSLPSRGDISSYLLTRVLTADDIKPATKLLHALRGSAHTAEVLHILAPLLYAIALSRTSPEKRRTSWAPWLVGLSVQLAARQLAVRARGASGAQAPALEKEEWTRRGRQMWWWIMRGAAYENVVKGVVGGVRRRVPGFVGTILEDYEYLWENYYFSTSDS